MKNGWEGAGPQEMEQLDLPVSGRTSKGFHGEQCGIHTSPSSSPASHQRSMTRGKMGRISLFFLITTSRRTSAMPHIHQWESATGPGAWHRDSCHLEAFERDSERDARSHLFQFPTLKLQLPWQWHRRFQCINPNLHFNGP